MELSGRLKESHKAAKLFDDGDHWQGGEAFLPFANADKSTQDKVRAELENSLETENIIAEVCGNEGNAMFGREPDWQVVSEKEDDSVAEEADKAAIGYWDSFNLLSILEDANRLAATQARAVIRAYVPKGLLSNKNRKSSLREAMNLLRFEVLDAEKAGVFLDEDSYQKFGILKKRTKDGKDHTEATFIENGKTFVSITESTNFGALADETLASLKDYMPKESETKDVASYDLGGELLYFEISRKPYITDSVMSNQKDVNLSLTAKNRLTYKHAFPDLFFFNAEQPKDKDGNKVAVKTGGKSANFMNGANVYDETGENVVSYANPSMTVLNPTDPQHTIKSKEASAYAIYSQCSQVHLIKTESALASGKSKRESRFSFEKHCGKLAQIINPAGRWMLKVLILFAADNLGQSEKYKQYRIDFNCRIDAGAPDAEEIKQAAQDIKDGLLDEETYLSKYQRFDDANAVQARLKQSESYRIAMWDKRLATAKAAADLGLPASEYVQIIYPDDEDKQNEVLAVLGEPKKAEV